MAAVAFAGGVAFAGATDAVRAIDYADPFVGTKGNGHCVPNATTPFGLVQAGPASGNESWDYTGGYQHDDARLFGFHQDAVSGTGGHDLGDVLLQPFPAGTEVAVGRSFAKADERARPGSYEVRYPETDVRTRIAAAPHSAIYRIACGSADGVRLLVDTQWGIVSKGMLPPRVLGCDVRFLDDRRLVGSLKTRHWSVREWHFVLAFDRPIVARAELPPQDPREKGRRFVLDFDVPRGDELGVKVALSARSPAGAIGNLELELPDWDFSAAKGRAEDAWADVFDRISVDADETTLRRFYTAMYHLCIAPNIMSDAGSPRREYGTFSIWDTFRAAHPLYTIAFPDYVPDFVDSILGYARRPGGYLPVWALWERDTECMIATHGVPVVVDAFLKGFPMDAEEAYAQVRQSLTRRHESRCKEDWDVYDRYGYFPFDIIRGESVSRTLECGYDDACAARMAAALGKADDAAFFRARSAGWTNVFDRALGLARGKDSAGRWREPYDPYALGHGAENDNDFTEGNAFQYTWHVMHDPEGLIEAMGGKEAAAARLDATFSDKRGLDRDGKVTVDVTGLIGQYVHGNEPSQHMIYFYPWCDAADRVPRLVDRVIEEFYGTGPDGLCGNEDCGQMSAWYVFTALGFYPFDPCGGDYVIGAPRVRSASVRLPGGKRLRIVADGLSDVNRRVGATFLDGRRMEGTILKHADLVKGGELRFVMAP